MNNQFSIRNNEMKRLRIKNGWTLQEIGNKYGITRERVRQIVGPTTATSHRKRLENRKKVILSQPDKTNKDLANELGLSEDIIMRLRSNVRHAIKMTYYPTRIGFIWEEWSHNYLLKNNIQNELQNFNAPYDIVALNNVFIDVKVATKSSPTSPGIKSPQYRFSPNTNHNKADIYLLIIAPTKDIFIVPANKIENMDLVAFCWPTLRPDISKMAQYHNRLDLIWKIHKEKYNESQGENHEN